MASATLQAPELLHIRHQAELTYGANQLWYGDGWQRRAGCGPTVSAHLLWYLSQTRPGCQALCPRDGSRREGFLQLMEEVWQYVTPGVMGVNSTGILTHGVARFGADRGVALHCRALDVPALPQLRPSLEELEEFLTNALDRDLPVAFLNLSNGTLQNLDNWHWVTLVEYDREDHHARMYDQSVQSRIALDTWLRTTTLGGGFVTVEPA